MELHAPDLAPLVGDGRGRGVLGLADEHEALRQTLDAIAMGHPHRERLSCGHPREEGTLRAGRGDADMRAAVLARIGRLHLAAKELHRQLHAVTDAKDRQPERIERRIHGRRVGVVAGGRPPRQDDRHRLKRADLRQRQIEGMDLGVHAELTDPARDELGVLRAEIEDEDE